MLQRDPQICWEWFMTSVNTYCLDIVALDVWEDPVDWCKPLTAVGRMKLREHGWGRTDLARECPCHLLCAFSWLLWMFSSLKDPLQILTHSPCVPVSPVSPTLNTSLPLSHSNAPFPLCADTPRPPASACFPLLVFTLSLLPSACTLVSRLSAVCDSPVWLSISRKVPPAKPGWAFCLSEAMRLSA